MKRHENETVQNKQKNLFIKKKKRIKTSLSTPPASS